MPLLLAPMNQELTIQAVNGDEKVKKHLESLGIVKDAKILILSQEKGGIIVKINNSRLALDSKIASSIFIRL